jgi:hypothetical protein
LIRIAGNHDISCPSIGLLVSMTGFEVVENGGLQIENMNMKEE